MNSEGDIDTSLEENLISNDADHISNGDTNSESDSLFGQDLRT